MAKNLAELRIPSQAYFPDPYDEGFVTDPLNLPWGVPSNLKVVPNGAMWGHLTGHTDRYIPNYPGRSGFTVTFWLRCNWQSVGTYPILSVCIPNTTSSWTSHWFLNSYNSPQGIMVNGNIWSFAQNPETTWVFIAIKFDNFSNTTGAPGTWRVQGSTQGQPFGTIGLVSQTMPAYDTNYELHFFGVKNTLNVYHLWNPTPVGAYARFAKLMFWPRALTQTEVSNLWMASQGILYTP